MSAHDEEDLQRLLGRAAAIEDSDADERWDIIRDLHGRTDGPAFDAVCALVRSDRTSERVLGLDILGQFGYSANRPFLEDTLPVLVEACEDDRPEVLNSAITALGHVADVRGLPAVLRHAAHVSAEVRFAVAAALPHVAGDPPGAAAVEALIGLSADADPEIRDWATMGLGSQLDEDTDAIREALVARLTDEEGDTAGEALLGLARRHDPRALPTLLSRLDEEPGNLIVEAAAELGAPEALPALERLKREGWQDHEPRPSVLDDAIAACTVR